MRVVRLTCRQEKVNTPDLNVEISCNKHKKITNTVINRQYWLDFFRIWFSWLNILSCSVYMNSVILLSVLSFSDCLNLLKEVGISLIFVLFVLERFTPDLSEVFNSFMTGFPIKQKPVHWFAKQINGLLSI